MREALIRGRRYWGVAAYVVAGVGVVGMMCKVNESTQLTAAYRETVVAQLERLSSVIEPLIAVDEDMKIQRVSLSAARMFEADAEDLIGTHLPDYLLEPVTPDGKEKLSRNSLLDAFSHYQADGILLRPIDCQIKTTNGRTISVRILAEDNLYEYPGLFQMRLIRLHDK